MPLAYTCEQIEQMDLCCICVVSVLCKQMRTVVTKYICEVRDVFCFLGL